MSLIKLQHIYSTFFGFNCFFFCCFCYNFFLLSWFGLLHFCYVVCSQLFLLVTVLNNIKLSTLTHVNIMKEYSFSYYHVHYYEFL